MAFRAFMAQHPQQDASRLEVVGIAEGYHGDTLGCMDAVAPSVYNGPRQTPWWAGKPHSALQCGMPVCKWKGVIFCPSPLLAHRLPACMSVCALSLLHTNRAGMMGWTSALASHQRTVWVAGTRGGACFFRLRPSPWQMASGMCFRQTQRSLLLRPTKSCSCLRSCQAWSMPSSQADARACWQLYTRQW